MTKRKTQSGEDMESVPLPIQTFFWRQTSPFIRPKLGKLCDASCISFERVVVQNILHGQPPSLCEAIQSVSRWKVIQVAFPHVMHACAALLENRKQYHPGSKFSSNETKLLYTLHWIILDAASECEDLATQQETKATPAQAAVQLHALKTIQLFVYLFAPLVGTLEDSDFQSLKLENGLRLWQPLWDFIQPDIPCFSTPVKPQRNVLKAQRSLLKVNTNAANIYIGKGTSRENLNFAFPFDNESVRSTESEASPTRLCPLARLSDSDFGFMSQSESQSVFSVCEFCNAVRSSKAEGPSVCKCGRKDSYVDKGLEGKPSFLEKFGSVDKDFVKHRLASAMTSGVKGDTSVDVLSASYFDVAVLQSLFCLQWSEDGIYWALRYIHQRLLEISDEYLHMDLKERERSRSLPFADPHLLRSNSIPPLSNSRAKDMSHQGLSKSSSSQKYASQSPGLSTIPSDSEPPSPVSKPFLTGLRREPPFKKVCMVELRQYPDSTRAYVRKKEPARDETSPTRVTFKTKLEQYSTPKHTRDSTGLYHWNPARTRGSVDTTAKQTQSTDKDRAVKTSLSWAEDTSTSLLARKFDTPPSPDSEISSQLSSNDSSSWSQGGDSSSAATRGARSGASSRPIITITQETPQKSARNWSPLYDFASKSEGSDLDVSKEEGGASVGPGLARSMTDTNISYLPEEEVHEVPGAVHYIQNNGHLNYKVILQAVHFIAKNHAGERICEVLLNITNCLLDLDIIEQRKDFHKLIADAALNKKEDEKDEERSSSATGISGTSGEGVKSDMTVFDLAMDTIVSVYKSLGCPHGCGDGLRGRHGDNLRQKGHNCLQRLQKVNATMFRVYLKDMVRARPIQEVVDFFHAFIGFCVDPTLIMQSQQSGKKMSIVSGMSGGGTSPKNLPPVGIPGAGASHKTVPPAGVSGGGTSPNTLPTTGHRKSVSQEALSNNGFSNNFGHSIGGVGYRGVEGVVMSNSMKTFVSRCVECAKELYNSDNISLFCDIRQLISYFKEIHGGTFRRVALSGLLDSFFDIKSKTEKAKETATPSSHQISRNTSVTSDSENEKDGQKTPTATADHKENGKTRKSIFRKKIKKHGALLFQQAYAASDSELQEDLLKGSPRASLSATEDDSPSGTNTPRRKFSKFHIGWRKPKSDHEEDSPSEPSTLDRRESRSETHFHRTGLKGKMSFKTASQATLTFLSARRRIESGLKGLGKKMSKHDLTKDIKLGQSEAVDEQDVECLIVREKKLVDKYIIKSGMMRFSFLLECCHPGTVPDPQLVAAMLQLDAPVSARATLLLECAHFVHRCNHGDWPNWMRLNLPSFRHSSAALGRGQTSGYRRTHNLQKAAGRMFYSWAENLGNQLEYIMAKERQARLGHVTDIQDEKKKRQLRMEDDEEDFLDENTVNINGTDCPYALKMLACLVLQEITMFLRENFQYLIRSKNKNDLDSGRDKHITSRRYSSKVSSPGHSDKSSESNIADLPQSSPGAGMGSPGDRKISFALQMERSDSLNSSQTSLTVDPLAPPHTPVEERKGRRLAQGRQKLLKHLRRGSSHSSSFRQNRSFRMRRQEGGSIKLYGSIRSRKVSSQSLQSEGKFVDCEPSSEDLESYTMFSDEVPEGVLEEQQEVDDEKMFQNMPWIRVVIQLASLSNFICPHQGFCHPDCYERQRRSCSRLTTAVKKIYESTEEEHIKEAEKKLDQKRDVLKERLKRRESIFQQSSPTKRRESTPLLEKIKTDVSLVKQKLNSWKKGDKPKEFKEDSAIVKYVTSQAQNLTQCPLGILSKAAPILTEDNFIDIMPVAWELMVETDQELSAAAASMFLIASVKAPEKAQTMVFKELQHEDPNQRINAVLRFGTLWKFRHQVWPRMEEGAHDHFRVPPPGIDFTLPSPTIGLPSHVPVDPPWIPHFKAKIEEVTVNQEQAKSIVTATTTRRKQQQEMIRRALQREEERKRIGRETFPMTTVSVTQLAAVEPSLHHVSEDHEEALQEEMNLAARRVSLAPTNRNNVASRSMSWRNGSLHWARLTYEGDEERAEHAHHVQLAQTFFPSSICAVVLPIIHLLEDGEVSDDGVAVREVAEKIIWNCLVEDPVLFLRHFLEKLTHKDKHEELLFLLRKLVMYFRDLPSQLAHSLFNYLIGYVMFHVRTPQSYGQEAIAGALAVLWQIVPSVEGIYFKDLKQTLKKEQCDPHIMISANVPSAKKIIVHGPDLTSIPSQFPIHEDTQFNVILQDSLDFFNIPEDQQDSYFLVDTKSNQIHNLNSYVRDFYFFRRNFYPQLSLVHMNPSEAQENLQRQAFMLKFGEIGKVMFTMSILHSTAPHQIQNHIGFLHEELLKLPAFPRKALDADFSLYSGSLGKELYGLDTLHKFTWVKLMHTMFSLMTSSFNWTQDLCLFLNVINGCIILHCEDTALLRYSLAVIINTSIHFKHIFSMNGFLYVMPTLLRTYSNHQPNLVLCKAIQFICKQFYILHRKPFMLQMFGSVASLLDLQSATTGLKDTTKVQPDCFFQLLLSLEQEGQDSLCILEMVDWDKPFKALDFCYENDPDTFNIIDVINMCVTVVVYAPDSFRSVQMLSILEVVLPRYLDFLKTETNKEIKDIPSAARAELNMIGNIGTSMKALITSCEYFSRSQSLPMRTLENEKSTTKDKSRGSPVETSVFYDEREDSNAGRHMEEGRGRKGQYYDQDDEDIALRNSYRKPRDSLLNVVAEYFSTCQRRMRELRKLLADPTFRPVELLDHKSHNKLADIAHTLLKLAPVDPETMACAGLQRYMTEILPITDWSQEAVRPALNLILRRLDRLFNKISTKNHLKRKCDWDAAANLLKGVFLTLKKFLYIAHLPHLKTLINVLIVIVLSSGTSTIMESLPGMGCYRSDHSSTIIPPTFCSEVVKLVAMQMQALGYTGNYGWISAELRPQPNTDQFCLEQICGGVVVFPTSERCINMLVNFILPLCIRVGCGRRDTPKLRQVDINYALTVILNVLNPPAKASGSGSQNNSTKSVMHHLSISEHGRCSSLSNSHKSYIKYQGNELLIQTAYLGLEILMACFDKALAPEWHRVAKCIIYNSLQKACLPMWKFLDFVVTHRPSIFLMLQPFIQFKMMRINCDTAQEYYLQQTIKDKLHGYSFTPPKCTGSVLVELALELKQIKEDFVATGGEYRSRSATMVTERSDFSQPHLQETRVKSSTSEITAEIIGPPRPTLATIGKRASRATILSQGSSNTSGVPFKATVLTSSFDSGSPTSSRKTSRRISAMDGMKILEKYKKPTQDDLSPIDQIVPESPSKLGRQPTILLRAPISNQNSIEEEGGPAEILYENEGETIVSVEGSDLIPRGHRLQRQDAKSRKTFKMKRTKTKTTSMRRFVQTRRNGDNSDSESNSTDGSPTHNGTATPTRRKHHTEYEALQLHRTGTGMHLPTGSHHNKDPSLARSVETIQENMDGGKKRGRPRYIQRSKSHDDPHADVHAPSGTVRGRIARQGARMVRSRSPSSSPVRSQKGQTMSPTGTTDHPSNHQGHTGPAEVPVNVTYSTIPGAGSPPQSAQSMKDSKFHFRFSLKKQARPKRTESPASISSPLSPPSSASPVSPEFTSHSSYSPINPFSPPGYDKPKPVITSPDKKSSSPLSFVQSRIHKFNMIDHERATSPPRCITPEKILPINPPPIPPRNLHQTTSFITSPVTSPMTSSMTSPERKPVTSPQKQSGNRFASRDRQRPLSPPYNQSKYQQNPTNQKSPPSQTGPQIFQFGNSNNQSAKNTNPFLSSPETPPQQELFSGGRVEKSENVGQAYVASRCSSDESLTEFTSLLKEDEKTNSQSSVCIYFDGKNIPDTLV